MKLSRRSLLAALPLAVAAPRILRAQMLQGSLATAAPAPPPYTAQAVHFDGSTFIRTESLTATDNAFFSGAVFFQLASTPSVAFLFVVDPEDTFTSEALFDNDAGDPNFIVQLFNSDDSKQLQLKSSAGAVTLNAWHSCVFSGDTSTGDAALYIDRVRVASGSAFTTAFTMLFNGLPLYIGDDTFGESLTGDIANLWLAPGQSLLTAGDIPEATLSKFVTAGNLPVDLGSDGSTPTGTAPACYFSANSGDAASFAVNRGTGGAFTLTGTLTLASGP